MDERDEDVFYLEEAGDEGEVEREGGGEDLGWRRGNLRDDEDE